MDWSVPEPYCIELDEDLSDAELLKGRYNIGYRTDDLDISLENNLTEDEEYVLWAPIETSTPKINNQGDLMTYHVARMRNAETMRREGLELPETALAMTETEPGPASFLVTPYIEHRTIAQRPKIPAGDSRRNNPHIQDPYDSPDRRRFEAAIDKAMEEIDDERLVNEGKIINAGDQGIDSHNKNWGLVKHELVRLDIGEVPDQGLIWGKMPYDSPQEFYREKDLRNKAEEALENTPIRPEDSIPGELRELMDF